MKKLIFGVGLNDANYAVQPTVNGKRTWCPFYRTWVNMLSRAYFEKVKQARPTYIGVTVCKEWHTFSTFKEWMMQQDWEGKALDKDLLIQGNREYGPDSCMFISQEINSLFNDSASYGREFPRGVRFNKNMNKFQSRCNIGKKCKSIGYFLTAIDAHRGWQLCKIDAIKIAKEKQSNVKLIDALSVIENKIRSNYEMGVETV